MCLGDDKSKVNKSRERKDRDGSGDEGGFLNSERLLCEGWGVICREGFERAFLPSLFSLSVTD